MNKIQVKVMRKQGCGDVPLPQYMSEAASGMDLYAAVDNPVQLEPHEIKLIPTGIHIEFPLGYEAQVRTRSGLGLKYGVTLVNTPGTIDSDYRGEIGIIMCNLGKERFIVERGMRIAQLVIQPVIRADLVEVERLEESNRGGGGFGHTG